MKKVYGKIKKIVPLLVIMFLFFMPGESFSSSIYKGEWRGITNQGYTFSFTVTYFEAPVGWMPVGDAITKLSITVNYCGVTSNRTFVKGYPISTEQFAINDDISISGNFINSDTCSGTWSATKSGCSNSGTWSATKEILSCSSENLEFCENATDCLSMGGHMCENICQAYLCPPDKPEMSYLSTQTEIDNAPVKYSIMNGMLNLDISIVRYYSPVDVYLLLLKPDGLLYSINSNDTLSTDLLPYSIAQESYLKAILSKLEPVAVGSYLIGWLITPTNGGNIVNTLNSGLYALGCYAIDVGEDGIDSDNDGYTANEGDFDDTNPDIYPGALEICGDEIDQDCDGDNHDCLGYIGNGEIANSLGMTFNMMNPGTFIMGSPEDEPGRSTDETQHQVTLTKPYYMQTTEVTNAQWEAIMGCDDWWCQSESKYLYNNLPVNTVSWNEAQEFINKLNKRGEGTYSLPTEAQWEYAARAGTTTTFSFGNCITVKQANIANWGSHPYADCPNDKIPAEGVIIEPYIVASYPPNDWGLYDMHGNVWEWCKDYYNFSDYAPEEAIDPEGPESGWMRVYRGGSAGDTPLFCRSSNRMGSAQNTRPYDRVGLRLILLIDK